MYANIGTLHAQHGAILTTPNDIAKQRGSGNWNTPPIWEQTTDRGYAWQNAYPMYLNKNKNKNKNSNIIPEPNNIKELNFAHFNTPSELGDNLRKRAFQIGSTGLHTEPEHSWERPEFEGVSDQYTEWALKSLQMTPNTLLVFFFNNKNIDYLQQTTINYIKSIKGKTINPQSIDELLIIMRNKYIYAMSGWLPQESNPNIPHNRGPTPCSLIERLERLNKSVLEETVKQILSGINQYEIYIKDTSSLPMPMSHPILTTMKGSRELSENIGFNSGHERTLAANSFNQRYNIL